jgi:hypothetical protein
VVELKAATEWMVIGVLAILVVGGLFLSGTLNNLLTIPAQNIYCNDFEFISCTEELTPTTYDFDKMKEYYWQCPTYASRCEYTGPEYERAIYENCYRDWLGAPVCENKLRDCHTTCSLNPGEYIKQYAALSGTVKEYDLKLYFCGKSPCAPGGGGVPVPGASGCSFVPSQAGTANRIYDQYGHLTDPDNEGIYTVPPGTSYLYTSYALRRVCGDTGEFCSVDSDCADRYPYQITKDGVRYGVTFQTGQMVVYGCKTQPGGECIEKDIVQGQEKCIKYSDKSYCDAIRYKTVECIPDSSSCGPNAVCKYIESKDNFECVEPEQKSCDYDWQCGQMIGCDWSTQKVKENYCNLGTHKCGVRETPVECCYDTNCAEGYYCDSDYKCKEKVTPKTECPYECCVREPLYFDKNCAQDMQCCPGHQCKYNCNDVPPKPKQNPWLWLIIPAFIALFALVGYAAMDYIGAGIGGIVGGMMGYVIYWFLTLPWWGQWLIAIGLGAGGAIIIYILLFGGGLITLALFYSIIKD